MLEILQKAQLIKELRAIPQIIILVVAEISIKEELVLLHRTIITQGLLLRVDHLQFPDRLQFPDHHPPQVQDLLLVQVRGHLFPDQEDK